MAKFTGKKKIWFGTIIFYDQTKHVCMKLIVKLMAVNLSDVLVVVLTG